MSVYELAIYLVVPFYFPLLYFFFSSSTVDECIAPLGDCPMIFDTITLGPRLKCQADIRDNSEKET